MTHLLDTHAVLWALTDPSALGSAAAEVVRDSGSPLVVSAVSAWELATKYRLGRLPQADALLSTSPRLIRRLGASSLPITDEHALLAGQLVWAHRDPFDRMLAAQAMIESLTLITRDAAFAQLRGPRTLWWGRAPGTGPARALTPAGWS